jgi:hypothetical protein
VTTDSLGKHAYRAALNVAALLLGTRRAKRLDARVRFGRRLDLDHPSTLADKVSWIELNTDMTLQARCSDKYEVRTYVEDKGLGAILVPLCGGPWESAENIDFGALPERFALKATHSCDMNLICRDRGALDVARARRVVSRWLASDYPRACVEPHYRLIPRRAYCEQYLEDANGIIDYKFHCIDGEPSFILTCSERRNGLKLNLYDPSWTAIPGLVQMENPRQLGEPTRLHDMLEISRALSSDFRFVRVDLYEIDGEIHFGELTFSPAAGVFPYLSEDFLRDQGRGLVLDELTQ